MRVSVAGVGLVTALGAGDAALEQIFAGACGITERIHTAGWRAPTRVAAELDREALGGRAPDDPLVPAVVAARAALTAISASRAAIPLVLASTKADLSGLAGAPPGDGFGLHARLADRLVTQLELGGVLACVSAACASGLAALALAARRIATGECERVLVVGVDVLNEFVMAGFGALHALDPQACRPFDASRRGVSLGEGAGAVLLSGVAGESSGVALTGAGGANDAHHALRPSPDGLGLRLAVERALRDACVAAADVDVLHLHGTATPSNDASEARALGDAFGGTTPPAFGSKGQIGHTLGAAGVIESIIACEALRRGVVPRNVGLETPDVDTRLDLTTTPRRLGRARCAVKVAGGFGGVQSALVFEA